VATAQRSFCRICSATCGITVWVEGDRVVKVRGDPTHPISRGYTCPKGRALAAWHHDPRRLDRPLLRGAPAPWSTVLDDLAERLSALVKQHGADAVGLYTATGLAYDSLGTIAAGRWFARLGSRQLYTAMTIDNAPAVAASELVTGQSLSAVWDPAAAGVLLLVGTNPVVSHGYGTALPDPTARIRDFRAAGGRVWVIDPRRTETADVADQHVAPLPGTDHLILSWLARELLVDGADRSFLARHCRDEEVAELERALAPFTLEAVTAAADVGGAALEQLLAEVRRAPGRLAVLCGTGVTMSREGLLACWLRWVLLILTGSLDRPGGMRCNRGLLFGSRGRDSSARVGPGPESRPELRHWMGQYPCAALVDEIETGKLRALVVAGGNPLTAFPDAARTRSVLATLDTLAVLDVIETGLDALATHVLSATGQLERADVLIQEAIRLTPGTQYTPAIVAAGAERRPAWWVFAQLARRMAPVLAGGADLLDGLDPDLADDEALVRRLAVARGLDAERLVTSRRLDAAPEFGWVHEEVLRDGRFRIAPREILERLRPPARECPALVLTPSRHLRSMNSAHYAHARSASPPHVLVHPETAARVGVDGGDSVRVKSAHGELSAVVKLDATVRGSVVSITHGWEAANVGRLTSTRDGVDTLTGMPQTSGVAVALERSEPDRRRGA